jgi:F-type H+-transporting ATPase subunit b
MEDRDAQIKTDMENARNNSADVDGMLEEANAIIAQAKKEAASIREKASLEATEIAEAKLAEAKAKTEEKYNEFVKVLEDDKKALENALVAQMPQYKEALSAKLSSI